MPSSPRAATASRSCSTASPPRSPPPSCTRRSPDATAHCLSGHRSAEPAHRRLLEQLGLEPLLDLGLRLGEASGAALAIPLLRAAVACHNGMATFGSAGVSRKAEG